DPLAEGMVFQRLLDAAAGPVIHPAVVAAPQVVPLDPSHRELGPSMRAIRIDQIHVAALAPVQGVVLTHDADRHGSARGEILRSINGLPENSKVSTGQRPRAGMGDVPPILSGHSLPP